MKNVTLKTAMLGLSVLAISLGGVACGKKKGGGGAASATSPAATTTDCYANPSSCTVGQQYASGVFLTAALGAGSYNYNQSMIAKLSFFGQNASGLQANSYNNGITTYNGNFVATGVVTIQNGQYYGMVKTADRAVSNFGINIDLGLDLGGSSYYSDYDRGYDYGRRYYRQRRQYYQVPSSCQPHQHYHGSTSCNQAQHCISNNNCYQNQPQPRPCTNGSVCPQPIPGYPNPGTPGYPQQGNCQIVLGDYQVTTVQAGQWNSYSHYGNSATFSNLKLKLTNGSNIVEATLYDGSINGNTYQNNTVQKRLQGRLLIHSVNGNVQCQSTINLR